MKNLYTAMIGLGACFFGIAHAEDLISCSTTSPESLRSSLRVFETTEGYAFTASTCQGLAHAICHPYKNQGPIQRDITRGEIDREVPMLTFQNGNIRIIHLFGEYAYLDPANGIDLRFPDLSCQLAKSDPAVVVGLGELGDGTFGDCSNPNGIGYLGHVQLMAQADAQSQCSTHQARRLGDFQISTECKNNFKTAVVKAIFRCVE